MNAKISIRHRQLPVSLWISGAVSFFAKRFMTTPSAVFQESQDDQLLADYFNCHLLELPQHLQKITPEEFDIPFSLKKWIMSESISQEELFFLFFCAELDNHYWLNLALQELQGAYQDNFPKIHLLCDLVNGLLDKDLKPSALITWVSVKTGLLTVSKQGPLVLSSVHLNQPLWQLLNNTESAHAKVTAIKFREKFPDLLSLPVESTAPSISLPKPGYTHSQVQSLDQLAMSLRLKQVCQLHLYASHYAAQAFAVTLAERCNLTTIIPHADWLRDPDYLIAMAKAYDWLLIMDASVWSNFLSKNCIDIPGIVLHSPQEFSTRDLALTDSRSIHYLLQQNSYAERLASWKEFVPEELAIQLASRWLIDANRIQSIMNGLQMDFTSSKNPLAKESLTISSKKNPSLTNQLLEKQRLSRKLFIEKSLVYGPTIENSPAENSSMENLSIENLSQDILLQDKMSAIIVARLAQAPASLQDMAFHLPGHYAADGIVLNPKIQSALHRLYERCLQRETLFSGLGSSLSGSQSTGIKALFSGESGTGKTLAASYLASQLGIPIYRMDLGSILNKYVGETEKNIHKLMQQAADDDYILLIDEADALFGKRTDAESGGERFANMLTNYLLARIEQHQGIVLMTTNGVGRIDPAFMRRFDMIVEFQSPELEERASIWQSHLGERSPGESCCRQLASLCDLTGGFIRNAVLAAAAEIPYGQQTVLPYPVLLRCLVQEYRKSGKPVPPKLINQLNLNSDLSLSSECSANQMLHNKVSPNPVLVNQVPVNPVPVNQVSANQVSVNQHRELSL